MGAQFSEWKNMRKTLWQDNRDIGKEKMWPLEYNSEEMEGGADKEEKGDRTKHFVIFIYYCFKFWIVIIQVKTLCSMK